MGAADDKEPGCSRSRRRAGCCPRRGVSPAVAGGSAYPAGVAAGTVLAATNGDIRVNTATANGDPDDGGQLPAAKTGDVHIGS
jgi:hypothetical protein